jgi:hypothetical protein
VVVAIDPFIPSGPPARVAEQNRCTVVDTGQDLVERLVGDELTGGNQSLEEAMLAVPIAWGPRLSLKTSSRVNSQARCSGPRSVAVSCPI